MHKYGKWEVCHNIRCNLHYPTPLMTQQQQWRQGRRRRALAPIRNDISERGRGREREKYNDGDDKSQVGLMIERKEEGKKRENGKSKRADDGNGRKHRNPSRERDRGTELDERWEEESEGGVEPIPGGRVMTEDPCPPHRVAACAPHIGILCGHCSNSP